MAASTGLKAGICAFLASSGADSAVETIRVGAIHEVAGSASVPAGQKRGVIVIRGAAVLTLYLAVAGHALCVANLANIGNRSVDVGAGWAIEVAYRLGWPFV